VTEARIAVDITILLDFLILLPVAFVFNLQRKGRPHPIDFTAARAGLGFDPAQRARQGLPDEVILQGWLCGFPNGVVSVRRQLRFPETGLVWIKSVF